MNDPPRIGEYRELARRLSGLLDDPQPGLFTWRAMFAETMERLTDLWRGPASEADAKREEADHICTGNPPF